ncbi:hypothetical protein [Streptomyces sp. HUAS TT20]|nr:hypothetical protein [Streptomyces sp. HUAS 15-9]UXY30867.1 hypothetical protein N8I87_32830 [Streptomyces sp. HUAS 15-9]
MLVTSGDPHNLIESLRAQIPAEHIAFVVGGVASRIRSMPGTRREPC